MFKIILSLGVNAIFAGIFGLALSFINLFWLQYTEDHYAQVVVTSEYRNAFEMWCGGGFFVLGLLRIIQSHGDTALPRILDMLAILGIALICMIAFTPVPGSHFIKYMIDIRSDQAITPTNSPVDSPLKTQ